MRKSYFLTYGSTLTKKEVVNIFENNFFFKFVEKDSLYFGAYFKYIGLYCDQIKIFENIMPNSDLYIEDSDIKTALSFSFIEGKNSEKKSKYTFIKLQLDKMEDFILFKSEELEE